MSTDDDKLTLANVRDGVIKYKNLRKNKLQLLCGTFLDHIEDLERKLGSRRPRSRRPRSRRPRSSTRRLLKCLSSTRQGTRS
jgi:hypothetical protein